MRSIIFAAVLIVTGCGKVTLMKRQTMPADTSGNQTVEKTKPKPKKKEKKKSPPSEPNIDWDLTLDEIESATSLKDTGLYIQAKTVAAGPVHRSYMPRFPLWSDGADKARWIYLPEKKKIDNTLQDGWEFPQGTVLWKEFRKDGKKIETRIFLKKGSGKELDQWYYASFAWNEEQTDAVKVPDEGLPDHLGSGLDIPSKTQCESCHGGSNSVVLGFSALQLEKGVGEYDSVTLEYLRRKTLLKDPGQTVTMIGNANEQKVLGGLHANCGHCHNSQKLTSLGLDLQYRTQGLSKVEDSGFFKTALNKVSFRTNKYFILGGGSSEESLIHQRISTASMPAIGVTIPDPALLKSVEDFIDAQQSPSSLEIEFFTEINPILRTYCQDCHGSGAGQVQFVNDYKMISVELKNEIARRIALPNDDPARMPKNGAILDEDDYQKLLRWAE